MDSETLWSWIAFRVTDAMTLYTRERYDLQEVWYPEMVVKVKAPFRFTVGMESTERRQEKAESAKTCFDGA